MECRTHCPKIKEFEAAKESLFATAKELDQSEALTQQSTGVNRKTRRQLARVKAEDAHEALRSISDADFYLSEATQQISAARAQLSEALEMQDNAIEICITACPTRAPVETMQFGELTLRCALADAE